MIDMIIMLLCVTVVSVYTFGIRVIWSVLLSIITAIFVEIISYLIFMNKNPTKLADLSTIATGMLVALALPSTAPLWLAPLGSAVAIAVAKVPFGHAGTTPFVPAAVGIGFITLSYDSVFTYPDIALKLSTGGVSVAQMLVQGKSIGTNVLQVLDLFVGRVPGPMGATCLLVLIGCLLFLTIRKYDGAISSFSFVLTCVIFALLFPRVMTGRNYSILMELSAGLLLYSAVFFVSDPVTSPTTKRGKILYGIFGGLLTMILRRVGSYEEPVIFAVLIMNAMSGAFDSLGEQLGLLFKSKKNKPKKAKVKKTEELPQEETKAEPEAPLTEGGVANA